MSQRSDRDQALRDVVAAHKGPLTSVIRGLVRDQVEAEDVLQDVFEEFIEAYDLGVVIEKLGSWLVTVARHKVLDRFRRRKTKIAYEGALKHAESSPRQEDDATGSWLREELVLALELLPPEQRRVFVMYELEGKSFKEIAAVTGAPLGTLMARKKYAVDFLRHHLKEIYDDLE